MVTDSNGAILFKFVIEEEVIAAFLTAPTMRWKYGTGFQMKFPTDNLWHTKVLSLVDGAVVEGWDPEGEV